MPLGEVTCQYGRYAYISSLFYFPKISPEDLLKVLSLFFPSAYCGIALPGQGALAAIVSVFLHPIFMAREECIWNVQVAQENT